MFTGLVQAVGRVAGVRQGKRALRLTVEPPRRGWNHRPEAGDSIAVSGCCLTVADDPARSSGTLDFDVVAETLAKTKIGRLEVGSRVNLEHAATASTLMGGHVVQGHVDGLGRVVQVQRGEDWRVRIEPLSAMPGPATGRNGRAALLVGEWGDLMQYVVPKGSITVDGVSLTVAGLWTDRRSGGSGARGFEVALIPTTLAKTTLKGLKRGELVNLEVDLIAKTVVHYLKNFLAADRGLEPVTPGSGSVRPRARRRA